MEQFYSAEIKKMVKQVLKLTLVAIKKFKDTDEDEIIRKNT